LVGRYPAFSLVVGGLVAAIWLSFLGKIGGGRAALGGGGGCGLGGMGQPFLALPPYYVLDNSTAQAGLVPVINAIMQTGLFVLGTMPLSKCRRTLSHPSGRFPALLRYFSINEVDALHPVMGYTLLALLLAGATLFIVVMGFACAKSSLSACLAFDAPVDEQANPLIYVVALRLVIWNTWGLALPAGKPMRRAPQWVVARSGLSWVTSNWVELCWLLS
jgi:hypothetical protein